MGHEQGVVSLGGKGGQIGKRSKGFGASRPGFRSSLGPHISSLGRVTERQSLPSDCQFLRLSNTHFFILFSFYRCLRELKRGSGP